MKFYITVLVLYITSTYTVYSKTLYELFYLYDTLIFLPL